MNVKFPLRLSAMLVLCSQLLFGQLSDSMRVDLSPHAKGSVGCFVGLGVAGGFRIAGKYHTTDNTALEIGYGVVPFLELAGSRAKIFSAGTNYYFKHNWVGTPYLSVTTSYANKRTTTGVFEEDIYLLSPMVGLDFLYQSGVNWFVRAGGLVRLSHQTERVGYFSAELGLGWEFF